MGRARSHGVIGQKNIVANVNSSNAHRGHSHTQHTSTRDAFTAITHPPEALSEPTHIYRRCSENSAHPQQKWCSQHMPAGPLSKPAHSMGDTVAASTFPETLPEQHASMGNLSQPADISVILQGCLYLAGVSETGHCRDAVLQSLLPTSHKKHF